ncbi:MAG: hypothetical protein CSA05_01445 [Bacteroidia bacterium]|nr:MAG: hypothetical protein CSA05_01445 [Bacteroidia bacterium]
MIQKLQQTQRLIYLFFKNELLRILTDSGVMLVVIGSLAYALIYAFVYGNDVLREIPIAIVDLDNSQSSRKASLMIDETSGIDIRYKTGNFEEAKSLFWNEQIHGIILIPNNFEKDIYNQKQTNISVYSDGSYFLMYKQTLTSALQAIETLNGEIEKKRLISSGLPQRQAENRLNPINTKITELYNPGGGYSLYVMPALIIVIIQQTLMVAIGILGATRKEKGELNFGKNIIHRENVLYSLVFGKSLAYLLVYSIICIFSLFWFHNWFGYPDKSNFLEVSMLVLPFLLSSIFLGQTLSNLFQRREHAIIFMVFLSPIILFLSGISWPKDLIPEPLFLLGHVFPSTKMLPAYLRLRTMGVGLVNIKPELLFLVIQAIIYYFICVLSFKLGLHRRKKANCC